ncbi:hypothetical protein DSO57_1007140 [Entomophthora muscae]|uniref:Uncharacterized protein n=1 Tax=Entomophthora muscae TaxID=34485 RepID=A0ACC2T7G6_9FUNG|nr:hypothetical protein DSO57_1007140 [Entomophthora muscae]
MWVGGPTVHRPGGPGESRFRVQFPLLGLGFQRRRIVNPDTQAPEGEFFSKLQEEQARTVSKFHSLANQVAPKKQKSKEQDYQEDVQKVVKKKYKVAEIKKYLEDVATALAGGFNYHNKPCFALPGKETTLSKTGSSLYFSVDIKSVNMATVNIIIVDMGAVAPDSNSNLPLLLAYPCS